jgi:hypothetical protein
VTAKEAPRNGVARLLEETGLTAGKLEKLCFVAYPDAPAGRETIRRYASGERGEPDWNEEVILALALATQRSVESISKIAHERLVSRREFYNQPPIILGMLTSAA